MKPRILVLSLLFGSIFFLGAQPDSSLEAIRSVRDPEVRLRAYDDWAAARGIYPVEKPGDPGKWIVSETRAFDTRLPEVRFKLPQENGPSRWEDGITLNLLVRDRGTTLSIDWKNYLGFNSRVELKTDGDLPFTDQWILSDDKTETHFRLSSVDLINTLLQSDTAVCRLNRTGEEPLIAEFDLRGLAAAAVPYSPRLSWNVYKTSPEDTVIWSYGFPPSADPHAIADPSDQFLADALFSNLFYIDPETGTPKPDLAETVSISEDGLTWTIKLRPAVFSDGTPVTADAVVDGWKRLLAPWAARPFGWLADGIIKNSREYRTKKAAEALLGLRALDDRTLVIQLEKPSGDLKRLLAHGAFAVVPTHTIAASPDSWLHPGLFVSSGPYTLEASKRNTLFILKPNPRYDGPRKPDLIRPVLLFTRDTDVLTRAPRRAEAAWVRNLPPGISPGAPGGALDVMPLHGTGSFHLRTTQAPMNNRTLRAALALSLDYDQLARAGNRAPGGTYLPWMPRPDGRPEAVTKRRRKALRLFEIAKQETEISSLYFLILKNAEIKPLVQEAVHQWQQTLGLEVKIIEEDGEIYNQKRSQGLFHLIYEGWVGDYRDPANFFRPLVTNPTSDWAEEEFLRAVAGLDRVLDEEGRFAAGEEIESILMTHTPLIPVCRYEIGSWSDPARLLLPRDWGMNRRPLWAVRKTETVDRSE